MDPTAPLPLHRLHDEDVECLLASGERRAELTALFGEDGYRELGALARRAARTRRAGGPAVYVLPGLMGSRIGSRGRLIDDVLWLDPLEIAAGHLTRLALPRGAGLVALGAMLLNSLKLKLSLQIAGFDARFHAYDWRASVAHLAAGLLARIASDGGRETLIVGHSMGGVVARAALALDGGRIARVVQLGAPNLGSFAPVQALRGVYPTVRKLAALDLQHDAEDLARIIFRTLPSLHELLPDPARAPGPDLFDPAEWPDDGLRPDHALLSAAASARRHWPAADPRCLHIVGVRQETVTRVERRNGGFRYRVERAGDGTVPVTLATMPGAAHWYVAEKHGGLPNNGRVISAVVDLLRRGVTDRLPSTTRRARTPSGRTVGEAALRRVAPHKVRWQDLSQDARRRLLEPVVSPEFHGVVPLQALSAQPMTAHARSAARRRRIELRLDPGSIVDANARALVLGVYRNVDPSGAAAAVDERLGGAVREFTLRRMFSGHLGQVFVLPTPRSPLLAELVLFAGLGDFDGFGPEAQEFVAENVVRTFARTRVEDFATVLFGTGSGVPVVEALEWQLQGFLNGLRRADPEGIVRRITVCEIDRRRFVALQKTMPRLLGRLAGDDLEIVVDEAMPAAPAAAMPRRSEAASRRGAWIADPVYLMVTLEEPDRIHWDCRASLLTAGAKAAVLSGTTRLRRAELRASLAQIAPGALSARSLTRLGRELARLLLPPSVRDGLQAMARRPLVIVHDREASLVPWETLRIGDAHPALEQGLSRRYASEGLSVARWREDRRPGERFRMLLAVNPTLDLPGAAEEGSQLRESLLGHGVQLEVLEGGTATRERLLSELAAGTFDALHFAGHAFYDATRPGRSGLVCAGGTVLRGEDLRGIGDLPALVFFNACEAARIRRPGPGPRRALRGLERSSSLAEGFLDGGVANFIGTHWPVGDAAALGFSTRLYTRLLDGASLGEAMLEARRHVRDLRSVDWADYVHYGNPAFQLRLPHP